MSGPYFESGYIDANYFEGDGVTQSADATLTSAASVTVSGSITRGGDSTLTVSTTHSTDVIRNRVATVNITDAFNVTFTVNASKNMLSDIISQFNTSITASKIASNQSTLNNIVTLSLQGDRSRALAATTLSSEFTQSTQIQRILTAQSTHNAEFAISISANKILLGISTLNTEFGFNVNISTLKAVSATVNSVFAQSVGAVKTVHSVSTFNNTFIITNQNPAVSMNFFVGTLETAQSNISSQFGLTITFTTFVSKWFNHPYRPLNLLEPAGAPGRRIFSTSIKKFGSHALGGDNSKIRLNAGQGNDIDGNFTVNDLPDLFGINDDIYKDLWMRVDGGENFTRRIWDFGLGPAVGIYNRKLYVTNSYFINNGWTQPTYGSSTEPFPIMSTQLDTGVFHHVAYIYTASQKRHSLYVNGTRVITALPGFSGNAPNWYETSQNDTLIPVYFDSNATFNQYYDDMKWFRNYTFGYTANDTTIAVPSTEYTPLDNVYTNLGALYRFDDNYLDSLAVVLSANGTLSATATIVATAGKSVSASATVNTQFAVSVIIGEIEPAVISMNIESSLSTVATRIKSFTVSMNAEVAQSVGVVKTTNTTITLNSAVSISCTVTRIFVLQSNFAAIASQLGVVARVGAGLILAEVFVNQSVTAVKTTNVTATLNAVSTIAVSADRVRLTTVSTAVEFNLNAVNSRIRSLNSAQQTDSALTVTTVRIRGSQSTQNSTFSIFCEPLPILNAISNQSAQFTQLTVANRIRSNSVTLNTNFTQQSAGIIAVDAVADLATAFTCAATILRIKSGVVAMAAIAVNLTASAKTGTGLVTIEIQSQCTTTAQKIARGTVNVTSTAQFASIIERIQQGVASITSTFTQIANGILSTDVVANMNTLFSTTVTAQKTVRGIANISSTGGFVMAVAAIRNGEILMLTQASITAAVRRTRLTGANLTNSFTVNILAGKAAVAQSAINVTVTQNITAGVLRLQDIIYYVPTETRTFNINNEQRTYALRQENRLYTIEE